MPVAISEEEINAAWARMIHTESRGRQFDSDGVPLESPKGAIGIAQVMPGTAPEAAELAGLDWDEQRYRTDQDYNLALGRAYFEKQVRDFRSLRHGVAAYNAGPGRVREHLQTGAALPLETRNYLTSVLGGATQVSAPPQVISLWDQVQASQQLDNPVVSATVRALEPPLPPWQQEFNPYEHLAEGEELVAGEFAEAGSLEEMQRIRERMTREVELRRAVAQGPVPAPLMGIGTALTDPTTWLPVAGALRRGASVVERATAVGLGTAGAVGLSEGVLQATQQVRPASETVASVITGGVLGAGLGAGVAVLGRSSERAAARAAQRAEDDFAAERARESLARDRAEPRPDYDPRAAEGPDFEYIPGRELIIPGRDMMVPPGRGSYPPEPPVLPPARQRLLPGLPRSLEDIAAEVEATRRATREQAQILEDVAPETFTRPGTSPRPSEDIVSPRQAGETVPDEMPPEGEPWPSDLHDLSVGAASVRANPEDTELAKSFGVAEALSKIPGLVAPSLRLMTSPLPSAREGVMKLVDTGMFTKGNFRGWTSPPSVETRIRAYNQNIAQANRALRSAWQEYRKNNPGQRVFQRQVEFREEIGRSLRRGDVHQIPEVEAAAKAIRASIFDPLLETGKREGLFAEDLTAASPETAISYLSRVYDREKIRAQRPRFRQVVETYIRHRVPPEEVATPAEYTMMADQLIDRILGHPGERLTFDVLMPRGGRGPMKPRTFLISDELIEPWLVSDVGQIIPRYVRSISSDVEMKRAFGSADAGPIFRDMVMEEANKLASNPRLTEQQRLRLTREAERDVETLIDLANHVRGTWGRPHDPSYRGLVSAGRVFRDTAYMVRLGSVLLSSLPDVGRIVQTEGLLRTFGGALVDLTTGLRGLRMGLREAQEAGTALDVELATVVRQNMDLGDVYPRTGRIERATERAASEFSRLTVLNYWNSILKGATSALATSRLLRHAEALAAGKPISKRDIAAAARAGIPPEMLERIAKQQQHWGQAGVLRTANTDAWTDREAVAAIREAILRDVDTTIITAGRGDAPLWTSTEWGKTIFQFKRFAAAATQRVLIAEAQKLRSGDLRVLSGMATLLGMGAVSVALKDVTARKTEQWEQRSLQEWTALAVDKSGSVALIAELDDIVGRFTGNNMLTTMSGAPPPWWWEQESGVERLLGPTAGLFEDARRSMYALSTRADELRPRDIKTMRYMLPGNNLFYTRWLFDNAQERTIEAVTR